MAGYEPWKKPDDFLYHYTTTEGLIGIITSGQLWMTNAGFLNDSQEITYGAAKAATQLRDKATEARVANCDQDMNNYVAEALDDIANSIESINDPEKGRFEFPYVASFSEERDDLSQWRGYAENGYCIAFHRDFLGNHLVPAGENVTLGVGQNIPLLQKTYYGNSTESHFQEYVDLAVTALYQNGYPAAPPGINTYYMIKRVIAPALALAKHPSFKAENEWRILLMDAASLHFRSSPQGPVPYTQVNFGRPAIAEIMAAPGDFRDRRIRAAEELLLQNGYWSVPVTSSTAPYVG